MIYTQDFLDAYKRQNPVKYARKFGNKTLGELNSQVKPEPVKEEPKIKVELTHKEEIEPTFAPEPDVKLPEFTGEIIKPKRGRKGKVANADV